jgi:hypothetical protein
VERDKLHIDRREFDEVTARAEIARLTERIRVLESALSVIDHVVDLAKAARKGAPI